MPLIRSKSDISFLDARAFKKIYDATLRWFGYLTWLSLIRSMGRIIHIPKLTWQQQRRAVKCSNTWKRAGSPDEGRLSRRLEYCELQIRMVFHFEQCNKNELNRSSDVLMCANREMWTLAEAWQISATLVSAKIVAGTRDPYRDEPLWHIVDMDKNNWHVRLGVRPYNWLPTEISKSCEK